MNSNSRLSVELIPRDQGELEADLKRVAAAFPQVTTINIPDLVRYPIRSWDGCVMAKAHFSHAVPHIRAMDMPRDGSLPMLEVLDKHGIDEVLIVSGDVPEEGQERPEPSALEVIKRFKKLAPHIKVYGALDPYRSSILDELEYLQEKRDAGMDGLFTQPFFDLRLMQIYADQLQGCNLFWGLSPVTTERSMAYWQRVNRVVFPASFKPDLAWNIDFARDAMALAEDLGQHLYFMPIRVPVESYLEGVFAS
uniref:Methylenetetrahydrofolate reductase n=1 Tax=Magnetococcus massalia (strain MO-1) TaxID=451514 RepID=A0A1S7LIP3_MAGMO|nr:5,10-methylenetetrahydrofolate reductase [Candidatus Magnetococcus massalia]